MNKKQIGKQHLENEICVALVTPNQLTYVVRCIQLNIISFNPINLIIVPINRKGL